MAAPDDVVLPILKNIQDRIASFEKRTDANFAEVKETLLDHGEKIEAMQGLMHYHLGMTTEQQHQIAEIQKQKDLRKRVAALEGSRG
jgi:hypothetical protein